MASAARAPYVLPLSYTPRYHARLPYILGEIRNVGSTAEGRVQREVQARRRRGARPGGRGGAGGDVDREPDGGGRAAEACGGGTAAARRRRRSARAADGADHLRAERPRVRGPGRQGPGDRADAAVRAGAGRRAGDGVRR